DAGVVILQHTFPDGSSAYSMYGHIVAAPGTPFPTVLTCVHAGDVIGAITDVRPAPHVHFEIRTGSPDIPGPGYTWEDPTDQGWLQPSRFTLDWQPGLVGGEKGFFTWAQSEGPAAPPVELDDHSLIFIDGLRVGRLTADGRQIWRLAIDHPAV